MRDGLNCRTLLHCKLLCGGGGNVIVGADLFKTHSFVGFYQQLRYFIPGGSLGFDGGDYGLICGLDS